MPRFDAYHKSMLGAFLLLGLGAACAPTGRRSENIEPSDEDTEKPDTGIVPGPLLVTLNISSELRDADQQTLLDALNTWEEATGGQVRIEAVFTDTDCAQDYAIHLAESDTCGMTCNRTDDFGRLACADGEALPVWRITLRRGLDLDRLYFNAVHEIGHCLGLGHGEGFMRLKNDDLTQTFFTKEQLDNVAAINHLDRAAMPESASFAYQSHRERAEPFIVYQ